MHAARIKIHNTVGPSLAAVSFSNIYIALTEYFDNHVAVVGVPTTHS